MSKMSPDFVSSMLPYPPIDDPATRAFEAVRQELVSAQSKFPNFNTPHEGYAVILEELDELWDEVRFRKHNKPSMHLEAKQVAAMAIRFMIDLCEEDS